MEYQEFTGKTLSDAVTNALIALETSRDNLEYEVIEKGSNGFLGIGARDAKNQSKIESFTKEINRRSCIRLFKECISGNELRGKGNY